MSTPLGANTVIDVASVSKQFTAFSIALLVDAGELDLDADVRTLIPEVSALEEPITVRQLVHHTSGVRDQWDLLVLAGWRMEDVITTADALDLLAARVGAVR